MTYWIDTFARRRIRLARLAARWPWSTRNLRTLTTALARHGLRSLLAKAIADFRFGGPALLAQKFRLQRALLPASRLSVSGVQTRAPLLVDIAARVDRAGGGFVLDADYGMPLVQFIRLMNLWHRHPAITFLTEGCARRAFPYTIVVSPHPEHRFAHLGSTLNLAHNLAQRTALPVRVIIVADGATDLPLTVPPPLRADLDVAVARNVIELREHLVPADGSLCLVQFLVSGDEICPVFAEILARSRIPDFDFVLTDMYLQEGERNVHPVLLPGINLIHALNVDYFLSRCIMRAGLAIDVLAGAETFDPRAVAVAAFDRCLGPDASGKAHHVAFPMLRIAETRASIQRRRMEAASRSLPLRLSLASPDPNATPPRARRVSVVICTKDNGYLLEQLVRGLWRGNPSDLAEVVVVRNRTTNAYAKAVHEQLATAGLIKLVEYDASFSFSAQSNLGAAAASGEILLFLNDDTAPVNADWLTELIAPLDDPRIGVVGPLLLYPDQSVQHAGMFLGFNGLAGHTLRGAKLPDDDYGFLASAPRQVMAVTGAALCLRRADFEALNGFDCNQFALYIQDVDLCLRAHFSGLAVVCNPRAVLLHMESVSVKATLADPWMAKRRALEHEAFVRRWGDLVAMDPFHNPNFSRASEDLRGLVAPAGS